MEELKQAIREKGVGIGTDIVKVDSFLNHRIDVALATRMGQTIAEAFADDGVDCILTVEASGITVAVTAAQALGCVPVVFAKKSAHVNVGNDVYTAQVYSFTQTKTNTIRVSAAYLPAGARVLMPWLLSFAAGAMLYVVIEELAPQSNTRGGVSAYMLGFVLMMALDVALS